MALSPGTRIGPYDTVTSANIRAEAYDRTISAGVFALQDDVGSRIVSTVADPTGVLGTAMAAIIGERAYDTLSAQEQVTRFHVYTAQLRVALDRALARFDSRLIQLDRTIIQWPAAGRAPRAREPP